MNTAGSKCAYGRSLEELCRDNCGKLPAICTESISALRQNALPVKALFSGIGNLKKVQLLQRAWNQGRNPLKMASIQDYHAIADSLLLWFNSLPSPIIPCNFFKAFTRVQHSSPADFVFQLRFLLGKVEEYRVHLLLFLLSFLHDYNEVQRTNGITKLSLGKIFAPSILRPYDGPLPLPFPEDTQAANSMVDCLIAAYKIIFHQPQIQCSSPVHKPPRRPRKSSKTAALSQPQSPQNHWRENARNSPSETRFEAHAVHFQPTQTNLRVNILSSSIENQEESGGSESPDTLSNSPFTPPLSAFVDPFDKNLATVPESAPMEFMHKDAQLDNVVGSLLCGSLENMLFEEDDKAFLQRASSLLSVSSFNASTCNSDSSDEDSASCASDSAKSSPCRVSASQFHSYSLIPVGSASLGG